MSQKIIPAHLFLVFLLRASTISGEIDLKKSLKDPGIDDVGGLLPIEKEAIVKDVISPGRGYFILSVIRSASRNIHRRGDRSDMGSIGSG